MDRSECSLVTNSSSLMNIFKLNVAQFNSKVTYHRFFFEGCVSSGLQRALEVSQDWRSRSQGDF